MQIREIMVQEVHMIRPDATVAEAAQLMADVDVGALPVGEEGELQGIITDRDIMIRVVAQGLEPAGVVLRDVMSASPVVCAPDDPVEEAVRRMEQRQVRRLPVVDPAGKVVGMVALSDLVREPTESPAAAAPEDVTDPAGHI
jgi:CBS domain-containing protein